MALSQQLGPGGLLDPEPAPAADGCCIVTIQRSGPVRVMRSNPVMRLRRPSPMRFKRCPHTFELEYVTDGGVLVTSGGEPVWTVV